MPYLEDKWPKKDITSWGKTKVEPPPPRSLEDSPCYLRTTSEWNTTSVPFQSRWTRDSIREAENPAWPGSQVPSSRRQHLVTLGVESADTPKVPRGQCLWQTLFQATDIWAPSLPENRCLPRPGGLCQASGGGIWFPDPSENSLHRWECGLQK